MSLKCEVSPSPKWDNVCPMFCCQARDEDLHAERSPQNPHTEDTPRLVLKINSNIRVRRRRPRWKTSDTRRSGSTSITPPAVSLPCATGMRLVQARATHQGVPGLWIWRGAAPVLQHQVPQSVQDGRVLPGGPRCPDQLQPEQTEPRGPLRRRRHGSETSHARVVEQRQRRHNWRNQPQERLPQSFARII